MNPDMNDEQLENMIRELPDAALPEAWKVEVLSSANAAARAHIRAKVRRRMSVIGLAAVWTVVFCLNFATTELRPTSVDILTVEQMIHRTELNRALLASLKEDHEHQSEKTPAGPFGYRWRREQNVVA